MFNRTRNRSVAPYTENSIRYSNY